MLLFLLEQTGFIPSRNATFSTGDRTFSRTDESSMGRPSSSMDWTWPWETQRCVRSQCSLQFWERSRRIHLQSSAIQSLYYSTAHDKSSRNLWKKTNCFPSQSGIRRYTETHQKPENIDTLDTIPTKIYFNDPFTCQRGGISTDLRLRLQRFNATPFILRQRLNAQWKPYLITNVRCYLYHLNYTLGTGGVHIRDYIIWIPSPIHLIQAVMYRLIETSQQKTYGLYIFSICFMSYLYL